MPNTNKNILIDLRAIQKKAYNGVCLSQTHLIQSLIKKYGRKTNFILLTVSFRGKPKLNFSGNFQHIHLKIPNLILNLLFKFKIRTLNQLLKLKINSYYSPDLRCVYLDKSSYHTQYVHDIAFSKFTDSLSLKSKIYYWLLNPQKSLQSIDQILTNSKFSRQEIHRYCKHKNIKLIYLGLPKATHIKRQGKSKNFIMISSLHKRKAFEKIIEFNQKYNVNNEEIHLYGVHENNFQKIDLSAYPNLVLKGFLKEEQKYTQIQKYQALLYFSHYEGFGLPILEGLINKTPVISNKIPVFQEIYGQQINYLEELTPNQKLKIGKNKYKNQLKKSSRQLYHRLLAKNLD